jgi:small subunit ribosomal protein S3Ae
LAPEYFGNVEIGSVPTDDPKKLVGRIVESTLYDITEDFAHQYLKMSFQITDVDGKRALTTFKGHTYSRDYLRSLVRRRTTRIDRNRIKASQKKEIRALMKRVIDEKTGSLTFDQFVQEAVLGKIASDIYNEAKKITALRHIGIRKTKLISKPTALNETENELTV